jgi:hypothetical protein
MPRKKEYKPPRITPEGLQDLFRRNAPDFKKIDILRGKNYFLNKVIFYIVEARGEAVLEATDSADINHRISLSFPEGKSILDYTGVDFCATGNQPESHTVTEKNPNNENNIKINNDEQAKIFFSRVFPKILAFTPAQHSGEKLTPEINANFLIFKDIIKMLQHKIELELTKSL